MSRESAFERVERLIDEAVRHYKLRNSSVELPPELANIFHRWQVAYNISKQYNARGKEYIIGFYGTWLLDNYGIKDERTVREDLYAAPILFSKIDPVNREFKRMLAIERLEKSILKAGEAGKFAEQARLEAVLFKYLNPDNDPVEETDPNESLKTFAITPKFDPKLLGVDEVPFATIQKMKERMITKKQAFTGEVQDAKIIEEDE